LLGQVLCDRKLVAIVLYRAAQVALRKQDIANLVVTDREIPLPAGVGFILLDPRMFGLSRVRSRSFAAFQTVIPATGTKNGGASHY
jgi:hypothetical protein